MPNGEHIRDLVETIEKGAKPVLFRSWKIEFPLLDGRKY